ncbi:ATP-binding cassette domain-containing protein [Arthrobacter ruber]|uniref:ATP-binding cassette domain-containing protein n=1 Tax=Arthrobacter ruber TaxID=1258893 RepID=UPI000CF4AAA9
MSLDLRRLSVRIGNRTLVGDVSLSVAAGEAVALIGASGSSKSLTAAALTGSLPAAAQVSGHLRIEGHEVPLSVRRRSGVSAIRQDSLTALHPLVRIDRQLIPVLLRSGKAHTRPAAMAWMTSLLEEVGFTDPWRVLQSFPMELSGGQRQRVCIVQALACHAAVLIADEPTTALDVVAQQLVIRALQRATAAGAGVLLITHDVAVAALLCSRAVVIAEGAVLDHGSFEHLTSETAHPVARTLLRSGQHPVSPMITRGSNAAA